MDFSFRLPSGTDLWGVFMNIDGHRLEPWSKIIPVFTYDKEIPFFEMLVPTIDTVRFGHIMEKLINVNYPVLLTGDTGKNNIRKKGKSEVVSS